MILKDLLVHTTRRIHSAFKILFTSIYENNLQNNLFRAFLFNTTNMARQDFMVTLFLQTFIITSLNSVKSVTNINPQEGCEKLHSSSINADET